ncbi:hypothetical protein D3C71_1945290 [compost metagenome]
MVSFSRFAVMNSGSCAVSISPNAKVLAVNAVRVSRATDFISAMFPARAAAPIAKPDSPTREESPTIVMIRPAPFCASRCGRAAWVQWIVP